MGMTNEQNSLVAISYSGIVQPWTRQGVEPPVVTVKELSRESGVNTGVLARQLANGGITLGSQGNTDTRLIVYDRNGKRLQEGDLQAAAREAGPYQRAIQQADYRSRAPGGGPVIRRRIHENSLDSQLVRLGMGRLRVGLVEVDTDLQRTAEREAIAKQLGQKLRVKSDINKKETALEAVRIASSFMSFIHKDGVMSPQRPGRIKDLVTETVRGEGEIIFVNWICPSGTPLAFDEQTQKLYRLFGNADPEKGFAADYRLSPRIDLEQRLSRQIARLGSKASYVKCVADDNPYCLYPGGLRVEGEQTMISAISRYTDFVQGKLNELIDPQAVWVLQWSNLLEPDLFKGFIDRFKTTRFEDLQPFLPPNVLETELDVLCKHTSPDPAVMPAFVQLAKDVIVQYNVEMDMLYDLFGDCVVLAWNESTRRSGMLDALRKLKDRPPLPKIYVLHRKVGEEIENNF